MRDSNIKLQLINKSRTASQNKDPITFINTPCKSIFPPVTASWDSFFYHKNSETKLSQCSDFTCTYIIKDIILHRGINGPYTFKKKLPCTLIKKFLCTVISLTKYTLMKKNHIIKQLYSLLARCSSSELEN